MMDMDQKKKITSLVAIVVALAMMAGIIFGLNLLLADQFQKTIIIGSTQNGCFV